MYSAYYQDKQIYLKGGKLVGKSRTKKNQLIPDGTVLLIYHYTTGKPVKNEVIYYIKVIYKVHGLAVACWPCTLDSSRESVTEWVLLCPMLVKMPVKTTAL